MKIYTVLLADGTTGAISSDTIDGQSAQSFIGEIVTVHTSDCNGNLYPHEGKLVEVLWENKLC